MRKKIVVLTGAGVSAESGIPTFRASDGLWEGHRIEDVAAPEGWRKNPAMVLDFYNQRRAHLLRSEPNNAHRILAQLEADFDVHIITQNIDDLHERAGSSHITHLHGELLKARSTLNPKLIYPIQGDILLGDKCERGSQLRPHIVWFGEAVPLIEEAAELAAQADIFIVVGTSMLVYPAAGLIDFVPAGRPILIVDPKRPEVRMRPEITFIEAPASKGMEKVRELLNTL